jgi:hypothetical protein
MSRSPALRKIEGSNSKNLDKEPARKPLIFEAKGIPRDAVCAHDPLVLVYGQ